MNLKNKTFRIAAIAGIISMMLNATSSRAQTNPEMPTMPNNTMSESITPEQMRQQHQQMMGQMQQRMGQMQQQMSQMTPEQLQQHYEQMIEQMEQMNQMMGQMDNMMMQDDSMMEDGFGMPGNPNYQPGQGMNEETTE